MTIKDIEKAVQNGLTVHWHSKKYKVVKSPSIGVLFLSLVGYGYTSPVYTEKNGVKEFNMDADSFFLDIDLGDLVKGIENKTIGDFLCPQTGTVLGVGEYYYANEEHIVHNDKAINDYCLANFNEPYLSLAKKHPDNFYYSEIDSVEGILDYILGEGEFYMQLQDGSAITANVSPYINDY